MPWLLITLFSLLINSFALAEDELEWELDFEINEKSTLSDFPFEEIDGDELSEAAIEGALRNTGGYQVDGQGKPAFSQEKEVDDKRKVSELKKDDDNLPDEEDILRFSNFAPAAVPQFPEQVFQIPNGRDYGHLETMTVERP